MKNRIWKCQQCRQWFDWNKCTPAISARLCVFYGGYGRPPFSSKFPYKQSGYNNGPLYGVNHYCDKCV